MRDILIACCDGLAGFEDAITGAFPRTVVQRCVVYLIRNALRLVARRDAGEVADKRARERQARRAQTGKRSDQPARLVEGHRALC